MRATDSNGSSPLLIPYPDWSSNNVSASSAALVSTFRVNVDRCDRLWTVDTGSVVDFEGVGERLAAPRIRLFDLRAGGALLAEYALKGREYACDSSYTSIVADVAADSCGRAFAYAVDPSAAAMLVYSLRANEAWRLRHPYFLPDPLRSDYAIGQLRFQWYDGIFGVALAEADESGFRRLFAHPMSGLVELAADTRQLRNRSTWTDGRAAFAAFRPLGSRQPSFQAAASAYDAGSGVLFYSLVAKNAVGCWNSRSFPRYSAAVNDIVASDHRTMIYFSDLKVDPASNLWAISNRLPVILYGAFDPHDYNFRIFSARARHLIENTLCDGQQSSQFWSTKI